MNQKSWRSQTTFLLYLFLIPTFFLLHGYNANYGLLPAKVVASLSLKYFLATLLFAIFSLLVFQNGRKAFVYGCVVSVIYFFFGAFHDWLKDVFGSIRLTSYTVLLPSILFLLCSLFFLLKNSNKNFLRLSDYARLLWIVLAGWEVVILCFNITTRKGDANNIAIQTELTVPGVADEEKPDIFFVVLDEYTSSVCLKEEFDFDNREIDSVFKANHFFLSTKSWSNYNVTPCSLSSTTYLNYLQPGLENGKFSSKKVLQAAATFKMNPLVKLLRNQGYEIKNYGCFDINGAPTPKDPFLKDDYYREIDNQTFWSRVKADIGWNFTLKNIFTGAFQIPPDHQKIKTKHLRRNSFNWNSLLSELQIKREKPRFVYTHLILPHEPFYLDSNGKYVSDTAILLRTLNPKGGYIGQVKYCNKLLKELIPIAVKKSSRKKVVVIEGDHGFRYNDEKNDRQKGFMNLNAYFFSDGNYELLYDGISPVNTFRVILNQYFSASYPLLKDSSVYLLHDDFDKK